MQHVFQITDLIDIAEESKNKDRIIQNMKQEKEEMTRMFTKYGHTRGEQDKIIYNLRKELDVRSNIQNNTVTDLIDIAEESKNKDRIIQNMKQEKEEMTRMFTKFQPPNGNVIAPQLYPKYPPSFQHEECQDFETSSKKRKRSTNLTVIEPGTTQLQHDISNLQEELQQRNQMIEKLQNDVRARQGEVGRLKQKLQSVSEDLEQTKADQERNHDRNGYVSNNYFINGSFNNTQIGDQNRMRNLAKNVQHRPMGKRKLISP